MTYTQWLLAWADYKNDNPEQRNGQAFMNFLHMHRPDLHREIMEWRRDVDCFYSDRYVGPFLAFVSTNW